MTWSMSIVILNGSADMQELCERLDATRRGTHPDNWNSVTICAARGRGVRVSLVVAVQVNSSLFVWQDH